MIKEILSSYDSANLSNTSILRLGKLRPKKFKSMLKVIRQIKSRGKPEGKLSDPRSSSYP